MTAGAVGKAGVVKGHVRPGSSVMAVGALSGIMAVRRQGAVTAGTVGKAGVVKGHVRPSSSVVAVGALSGIMAFGR